MQYNYGPSISSVPIRNEGHCFSFIMQHDCVHTVTMHSIPVSISISPELVSLLDPYSLPVGAYKAESRVRTHQANTIIMRIPSSFVSFALYVSIVAGAIIRANARDNAVVKQGTTSGTTNISGLEVTMRVKGRLNGPSLLGGITGRINGDGPDIAIAVDSVVGSISDDL